MSGEIVRITTEGGVFRIPVLGTKPPRLEILQRAVGLRDEERVTVERIRVRFEGRLRDAYVDEDGFSKKLSRNTQAYIMFGVDVVGNVAVWVPGTRTDKERAHG